MLGWKILKNGKRKLSLKRLSKEEEELIANVERRYGERTRNENVVDDEVAKEEIGNLLLEECEKQGIVLDEDQENYLLKTAVKHIFGFGFLDELLKDDEIEEISIIGIDKPVYVFHRKKGWIDVNAAYTNEDALQEIINKMAKNIGRRITLKKPRVNAVLPDGSRVHATLAPISSGELTVRKFREEPFTPLELINNNTLTLEVMAFLSALMQSDSNVIIAGNTASGKTTLLNSLFSFIPSNERVLVLEETPEINIPHEHYLRMVSNEESDVSLTDLAYDSLRMRPDRTIIGEIRKKEEAEALIDIMLSGQAMGSYCTMHGRSVEEALQRLKSFGANEQDLKSIDAIIIQRRTLFYDKKKRKNYEVRRVWELGFPRLSKIIKLPEEKIMGGDFVIEIANKLGMNKKEFQKEIEQRKRIILSSKGDFSRSFYNIQKKLYGL